MQITTLGPLAVDGQPVRGDRLAAVLRELVAARGRSVSTTALVETVWDGAPPDDAAGAVQALVSRLRRLGLTVLAAPGGYRVPADQVTVDAVEARTLVERARTALRSGDVTTARRDADAARALFPEVPDLADVNGTRLLADVAAVRAEAALRGEGPYDEADLRRLVGHAPPDEPSAALLVRLLAAQGRDAEALEVVERLRTELAERYGTDPSPVVTEMHRALLRGELSSSDRGPAHVAAPVPPARPPVALLPAAWRRPGTPLVGRERDLAAVTDALADAALVTVVATGGAGKTRLAAEVARLTATAGRAVRVVELAGLRSPDEVLPAVLAALGGPDPARPDRSDRTRGSSGTDRRAASAEEWLRSAARDLDGLVVLDNCEHVLDAAATVAAALLAVAPTDVVVLATSRAPLSLVGEVVHRLGALPDEAALGLLEARVRAGGAAPGWDPRRALTLCRRLDNLPLALELAAARLRHMPIDDVLAGLADRFGLLNDALRGLPDRHASLWAMVDWSRELLPPADRDLLQRLAVIPASFTAEAAASVAGAAQVRHGLATLVEQSLLTLDEGDDGPPRYRMLETVREYGEVRLDAVNGRDEAMAGLVGWARTQAIAVAADFTGPAQLVAFARCALEQDNLIAALRWSIAHDDEAAAVDIAAALFHLWTVRGLHLEIIGWADALVHAHDPVARRHSAILHGRASGRTLPHADRLAWTCLLLGINGGIAGTNRLLALATRALRTLLAQRPDEISPRTLALTSSLPAMASIDVDASLKAATELVAHPDPYVQGCGLLMRAAVTENRGLRLDSTGDAEEAYHRFEIVGDHWGMGMAAQGMGEWIGSSRREDADAWLRRSERHLELVGAAQDAMAIRVLLDVQLALTGDEDAVRRLREAAASAKLKDLDVAQAYLGLGHVALRSGHFDEAVEHAERVAVIAAETAMPAPQARIALRSAAAVLHLLLADARDGPPGARNEAQARAASLLNLAQAEAMPSFDVPVLGSCALAGAALAAHRGEDERARELWVLGMRVGANYGYLFQQGLGAPLTAALGDEDSREPLWQEWCERSVAETTDRIGELMDDLLN